jgi:hypothetical protein
MNPRENAVYAASALTVTRAPPAQRQVPAVQEKLQIRRRRPLTGR